MTSERPKTSKKRTRPPTIVVDMDGVLATGGTEVYDARPPAYEKCKVVTGAREMFEAFHEAGIRIVIHTGRWESTREVTEDWLYNEGFIYGELVMSKPAGDVYLDDRSISSFTPGTVSNEQIIIAAINRHKL